VTQQADKPNDIDRNFLQGNRKKIAKFLMRTFTFRSTFLYGLYINRLRCYLMKIFSMAVRMRGARRRVKGKYSRNGERWEASVFIQIVGDTGLT
jgi:hypothetical protein